VYGKLENIVPVNLLLTRLKAGICLGLCFVDSCGGFWTKVSSRFSANATLILPPF
jgi:hypothetical protein